jgi:subtilisin-like proprotein convertase family protein
MDSKRNGVSPLQTRVGLHQARKMATKLALGMLAAALIATTALPAIAGKPDHHRRAGHHAQRQEQDPSAAGKRRGNRAKSVTKTFSSAVPIAMPASGAAPSQGAADPYPSTIAVSGFTKAKVTDVNLTLRGFSHAFPADIDILLVAPGGRNAVVMDEVGRDAAGAAVTNITLILDDEATGPLTTNNRLVEGSFQPLAADVPSSLRFPAPAPSGQDELATFDGIAPNGEWQLFIFDDGQGDFGRLNGGWDLEITAKAKKTKGNSKKKS